MDPVYVSDANKQTALDVLLWIALDDALLAQLAENADLAAARLRAQFPMVDDDWFPAALDSIALDFCDRQFAGVDTWPDAARDRWRDSCATIIGLAGKVVT